MKTGLRWLLFAVIVSIAIVLAACSTPPTPTPAPVPTPTLPLTPTPKPTNVPPTVDQVMASWKTSPYLDNVHLTKGLECQACHQPFPPQGKPPMATCLTCHKGSYEELGKTTTRFGDKNPHKSHLGAEPCTSCHGAHKPFLYLCGTCHTDRIYDGRYPTAPKGK